MSALTSPPFLMAIGALITALGGILLSRRGQRDTREQQVAANALQTRVNTVDELEDIIEQWKGRASDLAAQVEQLHKQHTAEADRQAARCQVQLDRLIDNVATLQTLISDDIARQEALMAIQGAQEHEQTDHGREWGEDEIRY